MPTRPTPMSTREEGSGVGLGVSLGESADSQVKVVKLCSSLMLKPPVKSSLHAVVRHSCPDS